MPSQVSPGKHQCLQLEPCQRLSAGSRPVFDALDFSVIPLNLS